MQLQKFIYDVPGFPKEGIIFKDITPLLQKPEALNFVIDTFARELEPKKIDMIIGIESRGFLFGPAVASKLNIGFAPVRKKGKLPRETRQAAYALEYGEAVIELHKDAIQPGSRVAIVDDLLATGGTAEATIRLVEQLGGRVEALAFVIELAFLKGREKLSGYDLLTLIQY